MPAQRRIKIRLDLLDLEHNVLRTISNRVVEGQVNMATDAEGPTRSMTLSLFDPNQELRLDSDSVGQGALFADRMLRAYYGVQVSPLGLGWVMVPVFTGPIVKVSRDDALLNVECQGKEALALNPVWKVMSIEKGVKKTDAIKRVLRERTGEKNFDIPDLDPELARAASLAPQEPKPKTVGKGKHRHEVQFKGLYDQTPWGLARQIAQSMSRQLYYDGRGRCRLRKLPGDALFTFDESLILTVPKVGFDMTALKNAVKVTGKTLHEGKETNKKGKPAANQVPTHIISGKAVLNADHPLSPAKLGRNGVPRYIPEFVTNDAIRSDQEATQRAKQILDDRVAEVVDVEFDTLPVPHLEEMDKVAVRFEDMHFVGRLRSFSLPLTNGGVMSVGYHKRVRKPKRPPRNG